MLGCVYCITVLVNVFTLIHAGLEKQPAHDLNSIQAFYILLQRSNHI